MAFYIIINYPLVTFTIIYLKKNMEGKSFTNFTEFKEFIKKHEEEQHVLFVTSGSKKLINGHPAKESIQYEWLKLVCKQGRATKPTSSKGIRPNQRSWKHDCGAVIRAVIRHSDVTGYQFVITKAILSHENHPTDHLTALVYPENRRIKPDETVDLMVGTKIPQSELQQIISQKQNKCVLGKDVENYRRKLKDPCTDSEGVEKILNSIKVGGGMVKYGVTPENEFLYLAYMTKEMIGSLKANKTILIIDCTYKVNEYLFPLLNVMCIDANGNGVPVLHAFVRNESVEILSECLSVLHDVCVEPQIFFVDKDFSEIGAIKQCFPQSLIRLCSFHTMTAVKKYLNTNVSKELSNKIFDLFKEQSYTLSEEAFELLKVDIISACPSVESYFQNNWWSISDMWAACRNTDVASLHITTTNHVESYHSRIKKHLDSHTTLSVCVTKLLLFDSDLSKIKSAQHHIHKITKHYSTLPDTHLLTLYKNILTPFGAELVGHQISLFKRCNYNIVQNDTDTSFFSISNTCNSNDTNSYVVSMDSCNCIFFTKFLLPCRHILSLRHKLSLEMVFLPDGCHFQNKSFRDEEFEDISSISTNVIYPTISAKTAEGRFKIVKDLTNELNCLYQNMGEQHFLVKLEQLKTFIYHIRANKEFVITNVSEALAETNISLNGGCVDAEFLPIASTSQALAETNVSLNGECVGEEFVPINRAQPFVVHNSENNLSGSDIVDSSNFTTDTFSNVMLKKVKTKGRPNNKQHFTKKKRLGFPYSSVSKKLKIVSSTEKEVVGNVKCSSANDVNVFVDNHVECLENKRNGDECAECGLEEVSKENCIDGKLMNWIGCMVCDRWFHEFCLSSNISVDSFICKFCN
ncbi:uncharacterized protein LOC129928429 [Biomphalaria glabrata]|uniref:Uncharacterized protein LOC129928429 n=1 Tax=Biomphalaria glabrata TaxID=6526 RepID=A0A9W3BGM2_BIOGL|nr:uncharacterized protein LOC129928429 [Biomphalaria glabrata]